MEFWLSLENPRNDVLPGTLSLVRTEKSRLQRESVRDCWRKGCFSKIEPLIYARLLETLSIFFIKERTNLSSSRKVLAVWSMVNIANLLGMLGVIGKLIFVGIEIRQNQEIAMVAQLSARNTALMSFNSAPLEGSAIALRLMEGGFEPEIDWTNEDERATLIAIVRVRSLSLLNEYYQYNSGLLD